MSKRSEKYIKKPLFKHGTHAGVGTTFWHVLVKLRKRVGFDQSLKKWLKKS